MFLTSKNSIIQYEQWEVSKQPFSSQYPIYVMNMRQRKDKWDGIKKRFEHEKLTWSEGFSVREDYSIVDKFVKDGLLKPPQGVINYGNLGCASAHMNVWKKVAQGNEKCALVLEDDSVPTDQYLQGLYNCMEAAPDFDIIQMVALRPEGDDMHKHGLLKVKPGQNFILSNQRKLPNVWASAYLLSKSGAIKLLDLFRKNRFDLSDLMHDWAMTLAINDSPDFSKFVVKDQRYFVHDQSDSDRDPSSQHSRQDLTAIKHNPESYFLASAFVIIILIILIFLFQVKNRT